MKDKITEQLYEARWAITEAIDKKDYSKLDFAVDKIAQVKADIITEDVEPERLSRQDSIVDFEDPKIVEVPHVKFKVRGQYNTPSGMAKGLVVHYTVSGRTERSARGVLAYLAKKGLGCPVMDENGVIYIPQGFDILKDWAYHAGKSKWKGETGISRLCIGMEVCCWGRDSEMRGGPYRHQAEDYQNIKAGNYEEFTDAQEESLRNFVKWLMAVNPEFDLEWLVGHDSISPGRKADPGASLSMSVPEFRDSFR